MKHFSFMLAACLLAVTTFAQSAKYVSAMEQNIKALDTTRSVEGLNKLAHTFERIATAEKGEWLPYYYAALAQVNRGYNMLQGGNAATIDPVTDKAEALIKEAEALSSNNSEIYVVKKMIQSLRFMVDPQARYMQFAPRAQEALDKAKSLNPDNPRVYLLEGQDKFYTPEQYGGSKAEAKKLFELAQQKYNAFQPASSLSPAWGKGSLQYFLTQVNQ